MYLTRKAARNLTRIFEEKMRSIDLKSTQFSLLVALSESRGRLSISAMAEMLGMERTSLTRNLKVLEKDGLIQDSGEGSGRAKAMILSAAGEEKLQLALPIWQEAQDEFVHLLSESTGLAWSEARHVVQAIANLG